MFKDDNTITHFRKPLGKSTSASLSRSPVWLECPETRLRLTTVLVQFSVRENLLVVTGNPESKQLKDMIPDIIKQVGPQQYEALKNLMGEFGKKAGAKTEDDDEDDVPPLVQGTFEDASKKWTERKPWVEWWELWVWAD